MPKITTQPKFRTAYGEKLKVSLTTVDARTEQCHKDECDISKIIAKYDKTGVLTHVNNFEAQYGDLTGLDYNQMLNTITDAKSMFEGLPSEIRNKFDNDPSKFLTFCDDENNAEAMVKMGLANTPKTESNSSVSETTSSDVNSEAEMEPKGD